VIVQAIVKCLTPWFITVAGIKFHEVEATGKQRLSRGPCFIKL